MNDELKNGMQESESGTRNGNRPSLRSGFRILASGFSHSSFIIHHSSFSHRGALRLFWYSIEAVKERVKAARSTLASALSHASKPAGSGSRSRKLK